jgi:hypothetical protein
MDINNQITQLIENNLGIKFCEIMRETGMKNGILGHYTNKLEKESQ